MKEGIVSLLLLLVVILLTVNTRLILESNEQVMFKLDSVYKSQAYKDSIYWEHIGKCSFIHNDSVAIGHQGYLYSKYHRKYIK